MVKVLWRSLSCAFIVLFLHQVMTMEVKPCNPLKESECMGVDQALSQTIFERFTNPSPLFSNFSPRGKYEYTPGGLKLSIEKRFDNPSLKSKFYILFGRVEFRAKASKGRGIISSVFLQSDDLDEIDIEWIGGRPNTVQTNYFVRGNISDYLRGRYHDVPDTINTFHDYVIDWTIQKLTFYIDGKLIREVINDASIRDYGYPQTPMSVYIGSWVGGDPENLPGTIEWAGGITDFAAGPFSMEIERILITDYSSGKVYKYADKTGDISSIECIGGEVNGRVEQIDDEVFDVLQGEDEEAVNEEVMNEKLMKEEAVTKKSRTKEVNNQKIMKAGEDAETEIGEEKGLEPKQDDKREEQQIEEKEEFIETDHEISLEISEKSSDLETNNTSKDLSLNQKTTSDIQSSEKQKNNGFVQFSNTTNAENKKLIKNDGQKVQMQRKQIIALISSMVILVNVSVS